MTENNRQHRRIEKRTTMQFCLAESPKRWDMAIIGNISVGGIKFIASNDWDLINKTIQLKIKLPELAPYFLELKATVLSVVPRLNGRTSDVRAKFIDLSEADKKDLTVIEMIINIQEIKDSKSAAAEG